MHASRQRSSLRYLVNALLNNSAPWRVYCVPLLIIFGLLGSVAALVSGLFVLIGDWFSLYHLTRLWLQWNTAFVGCMLLATALLVRAFQPHVRVLSAITGLLMLIAVGDSLDGVQNVVPTVTVFLWFWAAYDIDATIVIWHATYLSVRRQRLGVSMGVVISALYLACAVYYLLQKNIAGLVSFDYHPLYILGTICLSLLQLIGGIWPSGRVRD